MEDGRSHRRPEVVRNDRNRNEEYLADLLSLLRPAPAAWVQAAQELPFVRRELDTIVERAENDVAFRQALGDDPEAALRKAGYQPDAALIGALEGRLRPG